MIHTWLKENHPDLFETIKAKHDKEQTKFDFATLSARMIFLKLGTILTSREAGEIEKDFEEYKRKHEKELFQLHPPKKPISIWSDGLDISYDTDYADHDFWRLVRNHMKFEEYVYNEGYDETQWGMEGGEYAEHAVDQFFWKRYQG